MSNCGHEECKGSNLVACLHSSLRYIVDADGKVSLAPTTAAKQPFRCPVCYGTGQVPNGYYNRTAEPYWNVTNTCAETCRGCGGFGIVWSP